MVITRDVAWCDPPSDKKSCLRGTNSSAPQVTREKDGHDEISDNSDSDSSEEMSAEVIPEDTGSVSSDTRDNASVENFG